VGSLDYLVSNDGKPLSLGVFSKRDALKVILGLIGCSATDDHGRADGR